MKRTDWTPANYNHDHYLESLDVTAIKKLGVIGQGDVGITMVLGLMLYGKDQFEKLYLYDPSEANRNRLSHELSQIRSLVSNFPQVEFVTPDELTQADMILFVASVSVPKVGESVSDARLIQFGSNWKLLKGYAERFLELGFGGFFGVVSDPVDYLATNLVRKLQVDPRRVMGFGQGVMAARAAYYGGDTVRMFGPHGKGLFVANSASEFNLDESLRLSDLTLKENLLIREFGFKPYLAPALSSAAIAITDMLAGHKHYSSQYIGQVFWGEQYQFTSEGLLLSGLANKDLRDVITRTYQKVVEAYESASHQIEASE